jgi:large subunit ribosomal protein L35
MGAGIMPRKVKQGKSKLKTHKATSKRFRLTGSGKLMRTKGGKSHLRRHKSARSSALFDRMVKVKGSSNTKRVKRLAPYLKQYKSNPPR